MNKIIIILLSLFVCSCYGEFLDVKRDKKLAIPTTLKDLEALMDNTTVMNRNSALILSEISADDYILNEEDWNALSRPYQKNGSIWAKDIYEGQTCPLWNFTYERVLYANIALEGLLRIDRDDKNGEHWDRIKGTALFWRGWQFFQLAQIFCDDYDKENAKISAGIPLRLSSDINQRNFRHSIQETYEQVISDLNEALPLLPRNSNFDSRPSQLAVHALLARLYLQMKEYSLAKEESTKCLLISDKLIDYNSVSGDSDFPFPVNALGNVEQPLYNTMLETQLFFSFLKVDPSLLESYEANDLRATLYFTKANGYDIFKGSYNGSPVFNPFSAIDEIFLIRAESNARVGNSEEALADLNTLLKNRFIKNTYEEKRLTNTDDIISAILSERRKSLVFRGVRWSDLRRLRKVEGKELERTLGSNTYYLSPIDKKKYTWPIPDNVISLGEITQNER